jgi:uncharacterized membrane protein YiaA
MTSQTALSLVAVAVLIAVHLTAGYFDRWQGRGRELFLSAAGGVTVAYVVMQLLPALSASDNTIRPAAQEFLPFFERHGYFLAVIGIVVFYANANQIARSRARQRSAVGEDRADRRAFITSMILMGIFNFMVAYSLGDPNTPDVKPVVLFVLALALFYYIADESLHSNYEADYHRIGRWILSAALGIGWLLGVFFDIPATTLALAVAFFSGGILVTVLGHQLQPGASHKVWAFATGALVFSVLLMTLQSG